MARRNRTTCCCLHIKTCATIIAVLCIITEILSIGYSYVNLLWWIAPMSVAFIVFHVLVIVGICTEHSSLLVPAEIFLGIKIFFTTLSSLILLICSRYMPQNVVIKHRNSPMFYEMKNFVQHFFLVSAIIALIISCFTIYSFVVIHKARKWLSANSKTSTHPMNENVAVIVYEHPHQNPHYYNSSSYYGQYYDPSMQHHIYYVNPAFQRSSNDISPPGYADVAPPGYYQQPSAMSQSQLQRLYNGTSSSTTTAGQTTTQGNSTYQNIYPTLPSAPPYSP